MKNSNPGISFTLQNIKEWPSFVLTIMSRKRFWVDIIVMTLGMFIASLGVYFFLLPSKLIVGSITGLSIVISKLFPYFSVGTYIFIINAILLVLAFILIGNEFGAKTVYTALILGPMIDFLSWLIPVKQSIFAVTIEGTGQVIANPWFDLVCFVLILSAAQSILFSINASTGGLDILAKIFNKYLHISLGVAVTVAGGLICCTAFFINPVNLVVIGLVATWINGLILNYFMNAINSKTRVFIISKDYKKVQDFVINTLHRGCTLHPVIGGYSNEEQIEIEIVLTKEEFTQLITFMSKHNIQSFMTSDEVSEVYGLWNMKGLLRLSKH